MHLNKLLTILSQSKLPHSSTSVTFPTSYCKVSIEMMYREEVERLQQMTGVRELQAEFIGGDICHGVTFEIFSEDSEFQMEGF